MKNKICTVLKASLFTSAFALVSPLFADTMTWDADLLTPGAQDGSGTWLTSTTNFWATTAAANATPLNGTDTLVLGASAGGSVVTIDAGGTILDYSTLPSTLTINQNYTLAGLTANDGIATGLTVAAGVTASISAKIGVGVGGKKTWSVGAGSVLNLSGGGNIQDITGAPSTGAGATVNITAGDWTDLPASVLNLGGGATILAVTQTGGTITSGSNGFKIGSVAATTAGTSSSYTLNGGTITVTGPFSVGAGNAGFAGSSTFTLQSGTLVAGAEIRLGNDGGNGVLNIAGGTGSTTGKLVIARRSNATAPIVSAVNISGGVMTANNITEFGNSGQAYVAGSSATLNLTGGTLYTAGFTVSATTPNLATVVNLGGGTIGGTGGFNSAMSINLTGTNGNVTFKAADVNGNANSMTLSGVLTGAGGLTKTGIGNLTISGTGNTYAGNTLVSVGTLIASSLGTGNVEIADGATLTLNLQTAIGSSAILTLDGGTSLVNLNFTGTDQIGGLVVNGVVYAAGTYDAAALGSQFSGTGLLNVAAAVPEPATAGLAALGIGIVLLASRRNGRSRKPLS